MYVFKSLFLLIILSTISCASLSEAGKRVEYSTKEEAPSHCRLLGEVDVPNAATRVQVKIKLRNKAGELGGNFLVIDAIAEGETTQVESKNNKKSGSSFGASNNSSINNKNKDSKTTTSYYYYATGRAYDCTKKSAEF